MTQTVRSLRIIQIGLLVSIVLYVAIVERLNIPSRPSRPLFYYGLAAVAAAEIVAIVLVWRAMIVRPAETLSRTPDNQAALGRWRAGYILVYALSECVVVLGVVLRVLGSPLAQVWPFYLMGAVLLLFFRPRIP